MGLSHQAILHAHPDVDLVAACDRAGYVLDVIGKYTGVKTYSDYRKMLAEEDLDAVFIVTPSRYHGEMVRAALEANLHVFCEKPFCLDASEGASLAQLAEMKSRVNQVGYHYRFIATFHELKKLLDAGVLGDLHHIRAEAQGPVVLRPKGGTWRSDKSEGGGCLYDYAIHAIDLVNYLVGRPESVSGSALHSLFSRDVEDEVYANIHYADGLIGHIAANWSDESQRKMSVKVSVWGKGGKISADRQELQIYLREPSAVEHGLSKGWSMRYTTDLTDPTWFYLRGEEYSAQVDHFVQSIKNGQRDTRSTFRSAVDADLVAHAIQNDAIKAKTPTFAVAPASSPKPRRVPWLTRIGRHVLTNVQQQKG